MEEQNNEKSQTNNLSIRLFGLFLLLLAGIVFINSRFFVIAKVTVKGNCFVPNEVIIHASGINRAQNVFRVKPQRIQTNILKNSYIADAAVEIIYPNRIRITVVERTPLILLAQEKQKIIIGNDWAVIAINPEEVPERLPVVSGIKLARPAVGRRLAGIETPMIREIFKASDLTLHSMLRKIDLASNQLFLEFPGTPNWVSVEFGNASGIQEKIANLRAILAQNPLKDLVSIDLRIPGISTITTSNNNIP
jgi:cell division septal protein FtsQ